MVCGAYGLPEAHYVPRSKGGLGIEQNVVTLCRPCHDLFDHGGIDTRRAMDRKIKEYLKSHYPDTEYPEERDYPKEDSELIYQKYGGGL